ncbi:phosphopantetheine-binding protein [Streptomyces sp. ME18-1-4]|jgi:acyl carrier protein|uniref:phosphopantetheine-binding protein n=1 Tax=Streptomyces sp. ME18-1-4 TaxID=3028685 RepID=UPI0029AE6ADE|nr:phosphopantetheine-binding protein [Streptomyces sp. ME18-1-4]MDX3241320.1 phosphopantetheine-binding protein [Streptomyces sp. ME18-1-4]
MRNGGSLSRAQFERVFHRLLTAALAAQDVPEDGTTLADAGLDSFRTLALMMDMEEEFNFLWPATTMANATRSLSVTRLREEVWDLLERGES